MLQTIQLPLALRAARTVRITLIGGTFNPKAPAFPFLDETWRAYLDAFGMPVSLSMPRQASIPAAEVGLDASIEPAHPAAFRQTARGPLIRIRVITGTSNLPGHIADRMRTQASLRLSALSGRSEIDSTILDWPSIGQGAALILVAEHEGTVPATFVGLGERGKPAEAVADEAVDQLLAFQAIEDAAVDPHSADQILLPLRWPKDGASTLSRR